MKNKRHIYCHEADHQLLKKLAKKSNMTLIDFISFLVDNADSIEAKYAKLKNSK